MGQCYKGTGEKNSFFHTASYYYRRVQKQEPRVLALKIHTPLPLQTPKTLLGNDKNNKYLHTEQILRLLRVCQFSEVLKGKKKKKNPKLQVLVFPLNLNKFHHVSSPLQAI